MFLRSEGSLFIRMLVRRILNGIQLLKVLLCFLCFRHIFDSFILKQICHVIKIIYIKLKELLWKSKKILCSVMLTLLPYMYYIHYQIISSKAYYYNSNSVFSIFFILIFEYIFLYLDKRRNWQKSEWTLKH